MIAAAAVVLAAALGAGGVYLTRRIFRIDAVLQVAPARFAARLHAYGHLLPLLDFGPPWEPADLQQHERQQRLDALRAWFYDPETAGGLLLGGDAHTAFYGLQVGLRESATSEDIRDLASTLRSELKTDLHIRQSSERAIPFASSEEQRSWK